MTSLQDASLTELLRPEGFECGCSKRHQTALRQVELGEGVLARLPEVLGRAGIRRPFLIMDVNTEGAAGDQARRILSGAGITYGEQVFRQPHVEPDEYAVGQAAMAFDASCDGVLAVGSGTLGDISKIIAHLTGRPLVVAGTAPSMDGFASNTSSMIYKALKTSLPSTCPVAIVADTGVMRKAPMRMLQAGLGDMLAKYISICEWRISHLINGEYYCGSIAALVRRSLSKCVAQAGGLARREPQAIENITEGLILSGIAMSFAGISRPASGLEHYFSHIWDMHALEGRCPSDLHGIQVGVGTLLTLRLYGWLRACRPDRDRALASAARFDQAAWEAEVTEVFGPSAPSVIEIERVTGKHDREKHARRLERILASWPEILAIIGEELPGYEETLQLLRATGAPALPEEIGISPEEVKKALIASQEIRDKYICSRLLWDLGLLEEYAQRLTGV